MRPLPPSFVLGIRAGGLVTPAPSPVIVHIQVIFVIGHVRGVAGSVTVPRVVIVVPGEQDATTHDVTWGSDYKG